MFSTNGCSADTPMHPSASEPASAESCAKDCCILNKTRGTMSKPIKSGKKHGNTFCKIHEADSNNLKNTHLFQCNCCLNLGIPYCPEARHPHELKSNQIIKLLSPVMKKLIGHIDQEQHGIRFSLTHFFKINLAFIQGYTYICIIWP